MEGGAPSSGWIRRGTPLPFLSHQLVFPREEMHVVPRDSITYGLLHKQTVTGLGEKLGSLPLSGLTSVHLSFPSSS